MGGIPTLRAKRSANTARDIPAVRASCSTVQRRATSTWISRSARASAGSERPASNPCSSLARTLSENGAPRRAAPRRGARESDPGRDGVRPLPHRSIPRFDADALPPALRAECGLPAARVSRGVAHLHDRSGNTPRACASSPDLTRRHNEFHAKDRRLERRADAEIAREREAWRLGKENEVALLELKRADPVGVKEA